MQRPHRDDRRRAANEAGDAGRRPVGRRELERRGMAEPARERLAQTLAIHSRGVLRMRPHEGGRARPAVEVLVAAADREIGAGAMQVDRHRAGRVSEVPDGQRAGGVGDPRQLGHVVHAAAAVVDVGQHQQRDVVGQVIGEVVGFDDAQLQPGGDGDAFGDVEVGGEVAAFREQGRARRGVGLLQGGGGAERLEQVDRGRVAGAGLAGRGADQAADGVADLAREVNPAGAVPASDQAFAPFAGDRLLHPRRGAARQRAQRIAVEVDHAFGQRELVAQRGQRIGGVAGERLVSRRDHVGELGDTGGEISRGFFFLITMATVASLCGRGVG